MVLRVFTMYMVLSLFRTVHVLHGLRPFTEYRAMVAGVTNAGTGLFSDMFFTMTPGTGT